MRRKTSPFAATMMLARVKDRGFTLIEILVALAIVAIGTAAVLQTIGGTARSLGFAESKMLATWVASDRLAELRLSRSWPAVGDIERDVKSGNRNWHYREVFATTADPDVLRVDITVYDDVDKTHQSAAMFGYLTRYSPPSSGKPQ